MAKPINYAETNKITIKGKPGTTMNVSVMAFADKYQGATEQDKADAAFASGKGSAPSDSLPIVFPAEKPGTPTNLTDNDTSYNKTTLKWTAPAKAQAYVVYQGATAKRYVETAEALMEDEAYDGTKVKFTVVAYNEKYTGANEAAKMKAAVDSGKGGDASAEHEVTFPARPKTPTGLKSSNVTSSSVKLDWTKGSASTKATVLHRNINDPSDDPKNAIYMDYSTSATFTLDNDKFGGKLAGERITFWAQDFNEVGQGATDQDKAEWLNKNAVGSEWSEKVTVNFPAEDKSKE